MMKTQRAKKNAISVFLHSYGVSSDFELTIMGAEKNHIRYCYR